MPAPGVTIWARQVPNPSTLTTDVGNVKNTFSSWDNCMSEAYCKWPVIIAIVVASLTVLSIVFCLARCLCCGLECCCACFSCCNACCPSPRGGRRDRYSKQPPNGYPPGPYPPNQGYQPTPAPVYVAAQPPPPQFATFDTSKVGKPVNEDALPIMPTWDTATSKKVLEDQKDDDMEMATLDPQQEKAPMLANQAPTPRVGYTELAGSAPGSAHGGEGMPYQQYGAQHGGDLGNPYGGQQAFTPNSPRTPQSPYATPAQLSSGPVAAGAIGGIAGAAIGGRGGPAGPSRGYGMGGQGIGGRGYDNDSYAPTSGQPDSGQLGGIVGGAVGGRGRAGGPPRGGYDNNRGRAYGNNNNSGRGYDNYGAQNYDNNDDSYFPQSNYGHSGPYNQQQSSYSGYASSDTSTRYEPSTVYGGQESGTVYHSRRAPAPAGFRQPGGGSTSAQGGGAPMPRKPIQDTWKEV